MKKIFKFELNAEGSTELINKFITFLDVQETKKGYVLWAIVDDAAEEQRIVVDVYGTGFALLDSPGMYLKTIQDKWGYVWHFFVRGKEKEREEFTAVYSNYFTNSVVENLDIPYSETELKYEFEEESLSEI